MKSFSEFVIRKRVRKKSIDNVVRRKGDENVLYATS
jgi:hypothetical protein